ncbi:MAG TPA: WecB/TagA/CpsF family glycosyltransferase [Rhizomicrobium sp.]|nr:WecB/TagA/CpsF family glycosyltransferase [Rhizomicrobium sp.]
MSAHALPTAEPRRTERRSGARVYSRVTVGGIATACVSRRQLGGLMVGDCLAARGGRRSPRLVFASNGHAIAMAAVDSEFRATFGKADLIHADGEPVVVASRLFTHTPVPERSATTDFLFDAANAAREFGLKFYLLGSTEEINARAAAALAKAYPGVEIVGRRNGYFRPEDEAAVCEEINASGADVVWVGLGVPKEYEFCTRNKARLKAGWSVTCGGCFNFAAGDYVRAPQWMQRNGLEWLHRLLREPRRLFWRYLVTNPIAIAMLLLRTRGAAAA